MEIEHPRQGIGQQGSACGPVRRGSGGAFRDGVPALLQLRLGPRLLHALDVPRAAGDSPWVVPITGKLKALLCFVLHILISAQKNLQCKYFQHLFLLYIIFPSAMNEICGASAVHPTSDAPSSEPISTIPRSLLPSRHLNCFTGGLPRLVWDGVQTAGVVGGQASF